MSAIYTRKGYRYRSNLGVLPNSKYFSSVRNTGTILFSVCSEHHAHFTPDYPRWFARDTSIVFFRLNPCQVLLSFRAVQVKQLAFLASFLSDLFRSLATLSCRVLIVT